MRGPFRSSLALIFLGLAIFTLLPIYRPNLWILDGWGDTTLPFWLWPSLFLGGSVSLYRAKRNSSVRFALMGSFILLGTVAVAAYLTQGPNAFSIVAGALMYHCGRLNLDIKAGLQDGGRL